MSKTKAGERLPYLLAKLKTPRVLEQLEQTAAPAREQEWPYERFLETLLEAEVFARDASGARMRVRAAGFPALKTLDDFDWSAQPSAEKPLEGQAANLLFALVSRRYERGSTIVTSNRGFEQWGEILGDAMVAAALIDRLVHHATMITLKGKSYRLRERGLDVAPAAQAPSLRDSA